MEFDDVLRSRRMVRNFEDRPIGREVLDRILRAALRGPSAGNTQATEFVVLEGPEQTSLYWDVTLPPQRRNAFGWPGLLRAPVLVLPVVDSQAYVSRYDESDKAATGLGDGEHRWAVPYWFTDAAFSTMLMLMAVTNEGLGALFFGVFEHAEAVCEALGVPPGRRLLGTVAIGHPSGEQRQGRSAGRERRHLDEVAHRGRW